MSAKLVVTLNGGSTEEHHIDRPDLDGTHGDYRYSTHDGVLFVHTPHDGTTAYPLTSVIRWEVKP